MLPAPQRLWNSESESIELRFLHCSDIHLGRRPIGSPNSPYSSARYEDYFSAFDYVVDWAVQNKPDAFFITGDLFDKRDINPDTLARTQSILSRLKENGIRVLAIEGNHDKSFSANESWLRFLHETEYLELLCPVQSEKDIVFPNVSIEGIKVFGLGYPGFMAEEMILKASSFLEGKDNIILIHTAPGNDNFIPGLVSPEVLKILRSKVIYVGGGHLHSQLAFPLEEPFFFVPGSLEYWDVWERDSKGFYVFDTESGTADFHDSLRRERQEFSVFPGEGDDLDGFVNEHEIHRGAIVLVTVTGSGEFYVDPGRLEREIESSGALKAFVRVRRTDREITLDDYRLMSARDIEREVILGSREWKELGARGEDLVAAIEKMKQSQEDGRYDLFKESVDALLETIVGGGS